MPARLLLRSDRSLLCERRGGWRDRACGARRYIRRRSPWNTDGPLRPRVAARDQAGRYLLRRVEKAICTPDRARLRLVPLRRYSASRSVIGVQRERRRWIRSSTVSPSRLASAAGSSLSSAIARPTTLTTPTGPRGPTIWVATYVPHCGQIRKSAVLCPKR